MKRRVRGLIKRIIAALSTKTNELRTRITIFFLLHRNQSLLLDKFQAVVAGRRKAAASVKQSLYCGNENNDDDGEGDSFVMYKNTEPQVAANLDACKPTAKQLSSHAQEEDKCITDLTHILFKESEEEMKKAADNEIKASMNTKMEIVEDMGDGRLKEEEEEEEEEEDIDSAADVFIQRFRRQILLQKQLSLQESRSPTRILLQNL